MALVLYRVYIPHDRTESVELSKAGAADNDEITFLEGAAPPDPHLAEHHVLLKRDRWAIGRTGPEGTRWRIGDAAARERLFHPAWLWRDDDAFDADTDDNAHVAPALPLRLLIKEAVPLFGSVYITCQCLAAAVAALRRRKRPVAILPIDAASATDEVFGVAARAFGLALLTSLPPAWRSRLRMSTRQASPEPNAWDLVVVTSRARGFSMVDASQPSGVEGDIVASYILDRLLHKDPEAVEACAYLTGKEGGDDAWADGVRAHLAGEVPGATNGEATDDPDSAVRGVVTRIESGAEVRSGLLSDLAAITAHTGAIRPWELLAAREPQERARAVLGTLPHLDPATTSLELCRAISPCAVGSAAGPWASFLVQFARASADPSGAVALLTEVTQSTTIDAATRTSVWQEVAVACVERNPERPDEAMMSLWRTLPDSTAPDSPRHVALVQWARMRTALDARPLEKDAFLAALKTSDAAAAWAETVSPLADRAHLADLLRPAIPADPAAAVAYFTAAERARAQALNNDPKARLEDVAIWLPECGPFIEKIARESLLAAMDKLRFPAPDVAAAAAELAEQPGVSHVWMWLAVTSQKPGVYDAATLDATVVAFGESPPTDQADRTACKQCADRLARAPGWSAYEFARWVARLCLAPNGDGSGFCLTMATHIVRGVASRNDGLQLMVDITVAFLELPEDHLALRMFLARLLPYAWSGGPPQPYVAAIKASKFLAPQARTAWAQALGL